MQGSQLVKTRYRRILESCIPYFVSSPLGAVAHPDDAPLDLKIDEAHRYNPHLVKSGPFLHVLGRLDALTFGPVGMTMPKWVFYDCAEVPGGIFGFGKLAGSLPDWLLRALEVPPGYTGLVPLSMYVAIPMLDPGCWQTYTLCTINEVAPGAAPANLGVLTEAIGLSLFRVERAFGATQWRSPKLAVHSSFGPLKLLTAWTPAHSDPSTVTFSMEVNPSRIEQALMGYTSKEEATHRIDCDDPEALRELQRKLEAGAEIDLLAGPVSEASSTYAPILQRPV